MDHQWAANEIIRLLMLNPVVPPKLAALVEQCRKRGDWEEAITHCRQEHIESDNELLFEAEYWRGVSHMYRGAYSYAEGRFGQAIEWLHSGKQTFEREGCWYSEGIALMGLGQVYEALKKPEEALRLYGQSYRIFQGLQERYGLWRDVPRAPLCQALCDRLQSMIDRTKKPRGLHLVPLVGEVAAGEPVYVSGESSCDQVDGVILDKTRYKLLIPRGRKPKNDFVFSPGEEYFVVTVDGDSMSGANIHNGDLLLVKRQDSWPQQREIAVFQEEDSGPMVKKFYREANRIYLESANPRYKQRIYDRNSPTLRTVGVVVAILEELED